MTDFLMQTIVQPVVTFLVFLVFGALIVWWSRRARWVRPIVRKLDRAKGRELDEAAADEQARLEAAVRASAAEQWRAMGEVLRDPKYVDWQLDAVSTQHRTFLEQLTGLGVNCLPAVCGRTYPIVCFRAAAWNAAPTGFTKALLRLSIDSALEPDLAPDTELGDSGTIPEWVASGGGAGGVRTDYYRLLHETKTVKRWNMRGFELSTMTINSDGRVTHGEAAQITYGQNCLTSHVLGYELYQAFDEGSDARDPLSGLRPMMQVVPVDDTYLVLATSAGEPPAPFHPMISVQAMVVFRDEQGTWCTWVMRRSEDVAAMPGFWQFPPAGGFEIFGHEDTDSASVERQFSLEDALIREFLEEIFHDTDMTSEDPTSRGIAHRVSPGFAKFKALRQVRPGVSLRFLGVVLDLVSLRSEYSFLIVVEGDELKDFRYETQGKQLAYWGAGSSETRKLEDISLEQVVPLLCDARNLWNPSSAGLFALFGELTTDESSWLRQEWPDMTVELPAPSPEGGGGVRH
jgi:hypothetical protein